ncbi:MAG: hypothetical protein ACJAT4_002311 [Granulosicoccus sp.]|jgi:hypothetical protein
MLVLFGKINALMVLETVRAFSFWENEKKVYFYKKSYEKYIVAFLFVFFYFFDESKLCFDVIG